MTLPTPEQMDLAADWLEYNEGEGDEQSSCKVVAEWLRRCSQQTILRTIARDSRIPVAALRARLSSASNYEKG